MPQSVTVTGGTETGMSPMQLEPGDLAVIVHRGEAMSQRVGDVIVIGPDRSGAHAVTIGRGCWNGLETLEQRGVRVRLLARGERIVIE